MNKVTIILASIGLVLLSFSACSSDKDKAGKTTAPTTLAETKVSASDLPVAYVRMDTLASQYEYYKDVTAELVKMESTSSQQLQSKANALNRAAEDYQRKLKINAFVSQEAMEEESMKLQKMEAEVKQLNDKLTREFMNKEYELNKKITDTVKKEIAAFNNGRFSFILTTDVLLYADSTQDITTEVIAHLNAKYQAQKKEGTKK